MSTRILEVSHITGGADGPKRYRPSGNVYETFKGICPGDVLKVVDVGSGKTLITGIMCIVPLSNLAVVAYSMPLQITENFMYPVALSLVLP